ncbi:MAG TPA: hypothetical protein EYH22_02925 [Candidatus Nanopusillus sp.]|nr:hypothetical protein [Candidatus Nanopusillus sp.]
MKPIEILVVVMYLSFVLLLTTSHFNNIISERKAIVNYLERFYIGRFVIKTLTENVTFTSGICNLSENFTKIFDEDTYLSFLSNNNIKIPIKISAQYLNGTVIGNIGGTGKNIIEFRRVCNYRGQMVIVKVLV